MQENPVSIRATGIKYGLITAAICIVYFLIMRAAGFVHITALRLFNYAFLAVGIFLALNEVKNRIHQHRVNYLPGLGLGFVIVGVTAVIFSIFVLVYSMFIDQAFVSAVKPDLPYFNGELNPYILGVFIFSESLIFGAVLNFLVMQFFKRNRAPEAEAEEEADEKNDLKDAVRMKGKS
jgi:hypothetical protein